MCYRPTTLARKLEFLREHAEMPAQQLERFDLVVQLDLHVGALAIVCPGNLNNASHIGLVEFARVLEGYMIATPLSERAHVGEGQFGKLQHNSVLRNLGSLDPSVEGALHSTLNFRFVQ